MIDYNARKRGIKAEFLVVSKSMIKVLKKRLKGRAYERPRPTGQGQSKLCCVNQGFWKFQKCTGKSGLGVSKSTGQAKISLALACWPWSFISSAQRATIQYRYIKHGWLAECKDFNPIVYHPNKNIQISFFRCVSLIECQFAWSIKLPLVNTTKQKPIIFYIFWC